jgi:hypothetical protein
MPLLQQSDPRLSGPLAAFLSQYEVNGVLAITDTHNNFVLDSKGMPFTAASKAQEQLSVGCYITSQVTVIMTSIANRAESVPLTGQTALFNALGTQGGKIGDNPLVGRTRLPGNLPADLQKLLWQYEHHFIAEYINHTKPIGQQVRYLYFPAVVSDVSGGLQDVSCDLINNGYCGTGEITGLNGNGHALVNWKPTATDPTNESIKALMEADRVVLIAYGRYAPTTSYDPKSNTLTVSLAKTSQHKIAVSGFQPGKFPLLINDVGNGQRYKVRLSSDLASLKFTARGAGLFGGLTRRVRYEFKDSKGNAVTGRPFLAYEGVSEQDDPQVFFIEHYNYLHIRAGHEPLVKPDAEPIIKAPRN